MMKNLLFLLVFVSGAALAQVPEDEYVNTQPGDWKFIGGITLYDVEGRFIFGAGVSPLYTFKTLTDNSTLSMGSHLGGSLSYDNFNGLILFLDAPLLVHYNLGLGSTPYNQSFAGLMLGAGYSLNYFRFGNLVQEITQGPMAELGVNVDLLGRRVHLRGAYIYNLNKQGVLFFGDYINLSFGTRF